MRFNDIETVDDAKAYLRERTSVSADAMRMLCKQFSEDDLELLAFAREHGVVIRPNKPREF